MWPNSELRIKIKAIIRIFLDEIIDSVTGHFNLFFERSWHSEANIVSYGHDIEGTWLLTEAAELIADEALLFEVAEMALKMTDLTLAEGAARDGSIYYERDLTIGHLDTDKHWWPQAEAMVAYLNAYKLSNNQRYLNEALKVWLFIKDYLIDYDNGEWYWSVNEIGEPSDSGDKAGFWKCPYHNGRACLESIERLSAIMK